MMLLLLAYSLMVVAQTSGPEIIGVLHGPEAKVAATSTAPVFPNSQNLCAEYEAAHFDPISDVLHCAGMIGLVLILLTAGLNSKRKNAASLLLWGPPVYYLPAWIGHFWFQKDIPAVFSYGTTLKGWWTGESCAFLELFSGRALSTPLQWIASIAMAVIMVRHLNGLAGTNSEDSKQSKVIKRL